MSNYSAMAARIRKASTGDDLYCLDGSLSRVYNVGALTAREYMRLDSMIMDKIVKLEVQSCLR